MSPDETSRRRRIAGASLALALLTALLHLFWFREHLADDAFITMRYAANLSNGQGPVWNPGEAPVDGLRLVASKHRTE